MFKSKRNKMQILKSVGHVCALASVLMLSACGGGQQAGMQQQAPEVATMTITVGNSELEQTYPAQIKGKTDIEIRPQVSGFITKVHVDEGQQVHKGQVLFTIDQVQFQAAVEQAQAAVKQAEASLKAAETGVATAKLTADNKKQLLDKNIISQFEWQTAENAYQQALANLAQAKSGVAQAQAALTSARKNLAYTTVTAPSDGVIGSIPNREGSLASPSSAVPLTTVSDNSEVYAYFSLTEKDILKLVGGGERTLNNAIAQLPTVQLRLADGTMYSQPGKVATVSGVLDQSTGSANVRALFPNPSGVLHSGATGQIVLPTTTRDAIVIPQKATYELQDRIYVYVLNDSNKTVATPIKILSINDGQNYVVTEGLRQGDRIVTEGIGTQVKDGIVVKPKAAQQAAPTQAPAKK